MIDGKGKVRLTGLLRKPQGNGPFPTVIFVSGLGMSLHEWNGSFDEIATCLNDAGFLTLQFQFDIFKSDGSVRELALEERAHQFEDAFSWLRTRPDVDMKHMGILAQSYGVPTMLCADISSVVSVVLVSGVFYIEKSIRQVFKERGVVVNPDGDTTLPRSSGERTTVGKEFWPSLASFDPISRVASFKRPVLMIHGDQDTKVSTAEAKEIFTALSGKKKKLKVFRGGDHGITDVPRPMREEMLKLVLDWFRNTLMVYYDKRKL